MAHPEQAESQLTASESLSLTAEQARGAQRDGTSGGGASQRACRGESKAPRDARRVVGYSVFYAPARASPRRR
eukprot:8048614-Pyramimonas_sp.AAC.1